MRILVTPSQTSIRVPDQWPGGTYLQEEGVNITANSVHPGFIKTNLGRHNATTLGTILGIRGAFFPLVANSIK